jgi:hypothetical protein
VSWWPACDSFQARAWPTCPVAPSNKIFIT